MAELNFDANQHEPQKSFDPIPAGKYIAVIEASEMKQTQKGDGAYLELVHQVIDGEHKGRKIWARLNLQNKSQQTVEIAQSQLSSICRALGIMSPGDSAELHNLPMQISVKIRAQTGYDPTNEVYGWAAINVSTGQAVVATVAVPPVTPSVQTEPAVTGTTATVQPEQAAIVNNKKPWEK